MKGRAAIKAAEMMAKLRKVPRAKLIATAGLGIALFSWATQGAKTYRPRQPNEERR